MPTLEIQKPIQQLYPHRKTGLIILVSALPALAYTIFNIVTSLPLDPRTGCQGFFEPNKLASFISNNIIELILNFLVLFTVIKIATSLWRKSKILSVISIPITFAIFYLFVRTIILFILLGSNGCL